MHAGESYISAAAALEGVVYSLAAGTTRASRKVESEIEQKRKGRPDDESHY